jgi:glycosyltransferase involved in cell wall biosynthesis
VFVRIAQIAPLYESVPPARYGGTERVVSYLTEELVRQGHDVTLFASGDSKTGARLISACPRSLRGDRDCRDPIARHIVMIEQVLKREAEFDVIHFHIDHLHFPTATRMRTPTMTTLHGRLDLCELPEVFCNFPEIPLVSISNAQRKPLEWANWLGTVNHGLPRDLYSLETSPGSYLAFVGRISPEKGIDSAIQIALRSNMQLRIGAKVDPVDQDYFDTRIKPLLNHPLIDFRNEIGDQEKQELIGRATAVLFPIDWPEPFGLVMIEAMACGTPVIAFPRGSVEEIIEPGVNGLIVNNVDEGVEAVRHAPLISRRACRQSFEKRFTASRMVRDYVSLYQELIDRKEAEVPEEVRQCR